MNTAPTDRNVSLDEPTPRDLLIAAFKLRYKDGFGKPADEGEVDMLLGILDIAQMTVVPKSALRSTTAVSVEPGEVEKRLREIATAMLRLDGDRDWGFKSSLTTEAACAVADEIRQAADTIASLRERVAELTVERDDYKRIWRLQENKISEIERFRISERELRDLALAEVEVLRGALEQARIYVETDEGAHGRQFGVGNAIRAALARGKP